MIDDATITATVVTSHLMMKCRMKRYVQQAAFESKTRNYLPTARRR
jgi:hypothetical protein